MKNSIFAILVCSLLSIFTAWAGDEAVVIYWDSPAAKAIRARITPDSDYWQLAPNFTAQDTQSYCGVASAVTVLNSMPINKPVDPTYAPYAYFTQKNFFSPAVEKVIPADTVMKQGITRDEMVEALTSQGVSASSIAGDTFDDEGLRKLLKVTLGDDGQFVLANYFRKTLGQVGGGHWSALAAYDAESDTVLILDVAKYKYTPVWVGISTLRQAIATLDTTSNKSRGLVLVKK